MTGLRASGSGSTLTRDVAKCAVATSPPAERSELAAYSSCLDTRRERCNDSKAGDISRTVTVKIEGRVQGVYYRAWTYETARSLGLDGTVRNTSDGSVEAVFSGPAHVVAEMLRRCEDGPANARVTKVTIMHEGGAVAPGFKVIGTGLARR